MRLSKEFTPRILDHILTWGSKIHREDKRAWTKYDSEIYLLIFSESKKMLKENNEKYKLAKKQGHTIALATIKK